MFVVSTKRRGVCKICPRTNIMTNNLTSKIKVFSQDNNELKNNIEANCKSSFKFASRKFHLLIAVCCLLIALIHQPIGMLVNADESASAPAFDMSALASLASNPQIMSMVSSLLTSPQRPNGGSMATSGANDGLPPLSDLDQQQQQQQQDNGVALTRRGARQDFNGGNSSPMANIQQQAAMASVAAAAQPPPPPPAQAMPPPPQTPPQTPPQSASQPQQSNPGALNGLLSMVPSVLSSLTGGGQTDGAGALSSLTGSLGPLSSLLGLNKLTSSSAASNNNQQQPAAGSSRSDLTDNSNQQQSATTATAAVASQQQQLATNAALHPPNATPAQSMNSGASGSSPAQSVINQVLTAYASGQIPNELIQLGLSGRVPPQIIELALSGQVPPQIVQMIITGQVPMSTINTFLTTMQANGSGGGALPQQAAAGAAATTSPTGSGLPRIAGLATNMSGMFSTTRSLFETLFGLARNTMGQGQQQQQQQQQGQQSGITVPTLMGSIPLRMPSMPNMRNLGQMVGGTITNMASMIPF